MARNNLTSFNLKTVFIFILIILFTAFKPFSALSQEALNLSGRYKGYNVVLIILDALRPDHLSCYGYNKKTSPNIDALSKQSLLFSNAFSQATYTLPSIVSIFTSVYPYSHRVMHIFRDQVPDKIITLAQILNIYEYDTALFGSLDDPHSGRVKGIVKGFKEKYPLNLFKEDERLFYWIKNHKKRAFFITVHSYLVHESLFSSIPINNEFSKNIPRDCLKLINTLDKIYWNKLQERFKKKPKTFTRIFGNDWVKQNLLHEYHPGDFRKLEKLTHTIQQNDMLNKESHLTLISFLMSLNIDQRENVLFLFDTAIYETDKNIVGRLIKELKENNLYDKTIIIITADHGNEYAEHGGRYGHGYLYDEDSRVPLIIYLPDLKEPKVVKELTQSIDILPTTLDLLSIPTPAQAQGISVSGIIEGKKGAPTNEYVFSQGFLLGTFSIQSGNWKLIQHQGKSSKLFNLKKDPHELDNVINNNLKVAKRLKNRLNEWMKSLVVYQQKESEFVPGIDEETKERIKKTGYW